MWTSPCFMPPCMAAPPATVPNMAQMDPMQAHMRGPHEAAMQWGSEMQMTMPMPGMPGLAPWQQAPQMFPPVNHPPPFGFNPPMWPQHCGPGPCVPPMMEGPGLVCWEDVVQQMREMVENKGSELKELVHRKVGEVLKLTNSEHQQQVLKVTNLAEEVEALRRQVTEGEHAQKVEAVAKTAETLNRSESQREVRTSRVAFCGTNLVKLKEAFEAMKRRQEDFILQMQGTQSELEQDMQVVKESILMQQELRKEDTEERLAGYEQDLFDLREQVEAIMHVHAVGQPKLMCSTECGSSEQFNSPSSASPTGWRQVTNLAEEAEALRRQAVREKEDLHARHLSLGERVDYLEKLVGESAEKHTQVKSLAEALEKSQVSTLADVQALRTLVQEGESAEKVTNLAEEVEALRRQVTEAEHAQKVEHLATTRELQDIHEDLKKKVDLLEGYVEHLGEEVIKVQEQWNDWEEDEDDTLCSDSGTEGRLNKAALRRLGAGIRWDNDGDDTFESIYR
eukprot:symbB.v1.2.026016.t1/scaffold2529.1/size77954/4